MERRFFSKPNFGGYEEGGKMEMSQILRCDMLNCVYNTKGCCRTPGITVGTHAECNTYSHASVRGGFEDVIGRVGACLNSGCRFNDKLECASKTICVTVHDRHPDCQTYQPRD